MINRFALSLLCIELDRPDMYEVMLLHILLTSKAVVRCEVFIQIVDLFINPFHFGCINVFLLFCQ